MSRPGYANDYRARQLAAGSCIGGCGAEHMPGRTRCLRCARINAAGARRRAQLRKGATLPQEGASA